jgi:hypothetical protein
MNERTYQRELTKKIRERFPGCVIMKNDPTQMQGIPDILILFNNTWAMLEVKIDGVSVIQPNQAHYVDTFNRMSYASFINPDNEEEILNDLQSAFGFARETRIS